MNFPFRLLLITGLWLGGSGVAGAQSEAVRSPFMPPPVAEATEAEAVVEDAELQFCGVFGDGANKRFLIYNVTSKQSAWLTLDEEGPDELFVTSFDPLETTVQVKQGTRQLRLGLQGATMTGGSGGGSSPVALTGNSQRDLEATVRVNPTPGDERRRLEAVAAEVRRRRAARAAATSGNGATNP